MDKEKIMQRLEDHKTAVLEAGYSGKQILGIFLYGSQNYGTDTPASDVDTKCIIVPTYRELCLGRPVSKELHLSNGEHCELKDIREIAKEFRKQNINFLEILFTEYCWINPFYQNLWDVFFTSQREEIARYDMNRALKSISGQAIHTLKQNKTNGKKVSNGLRLFHFLRFYLIGTDYKDCIYLKDEEIRKELVRLKKKENLESPEQAEELIKNITALKDLEITYIGNASKEEIDRDLDCGCMAIIRKNLFFDDEGGSW